MKKINDVLTPSFKELCRQLGFPQNLNPEVRNCQSCDSDFCRDVVARGWLTAEQMEHAAGRYRLGRSKSGRCIFWMIDEYGKVLDGHIGDSWVSTLLKRRYPAAAPHLKVEHCLFGLHQISECGSLSKTQATPLMDKFRVPSQGTAYAGMYNSHPDPLMGRGYLNERATGGAVKPLAQRLARGLESGSKPFLGQEGLGCCDPCRWNLHKLLLFKKENNHSH